MIAVVETGSFRRAAEHVHKSQAAVSKAVKCLEDELGVVLFSRDTYRPQLTREGRAFYQKAREVVYQVDQLQIFAQELSLGVEPELNVAISAVCPLPSILNVIKRLTTKYSKTQINLSIETMGRTLERLRLEEVDMAITPLDESDPSLESIHLYDVKMLVVAAPEFEPMTLEICTLEMLKQYTQVTVKNSSYYDLHRSDNLLRDGRCWIINDLLNKKEIILAGLGWGQLPQHMVARELQDGRLSTLCVNGISTRDQRICAVRKKQLTSGPVAQEMWNTIHHIE